VFDATAEGAECKAEAVWVRRNCSRVKAFDRGPRHIARGRKGQEGKQRNLSIGGVDTSREGFDKGRMGTKLGEKEKPSNCGPCVAL